MMAQAVDQIQNPAFRAHVGALLAYFLAHDWRFDDAIPHAERAIRDAERSAAPEVLRWALAARAHIAALTGDPAAAALLAAARALPGWPDMWVPIFSPEMVLADWHVSRGELAAALPLLEQLAEASERDGRPAGVVDTQVTQMVADWYAGRWAAVESRAGAVRQYTRIAVRFPYVAQLAHCLPAVGPGTNALLPDRLVRTADRIAHRDCCGRTSARPTSMVALHRTRPPRGVGRLAPRVADCHQPSDGHLTAADELGQATLKGSRLLPYVEARNASRALSTSICTPPTPAWRSAGWTCRRCGRPVSCWTRGGVPQSPTPFAAAQTQLSAVERRWERAAAPNLLPPLRCPPRLSAARVRLGVPLTAPCDHERVEQESARVLARQARRGILDALCIRLITVHRRSSGCTTPGSSAIVAWCRYSPRASVRTRYAAPVSRVVKTDMMSPTRPARARASPPGETADLIIRPTRLRLRGSRARSPGAAGGCGLASPARCP
jgi:hypothetical protein